MGTYERPLSTSNKAVPPSALALLARFKNEITPNVKNIRTNLINPITKPLFN
jgi:hypothetical protein